MAQAQILLYLNKSGSWVPTMQIKKKLGLTPTSVRRALSQMHKYKEVARKEITGQRRQYLWRIV